MCGIAGIIDFRGRPIDRSLLERMQAALRHRGPDDAGLWLHRGEGFSAGLAHTRLAVIDPTPEAHQPMTSPDGRWVVSYNGELYNYRTLRGQLDRPCLTESDTEVVLNACIAWGPSALERFDAMWAMAFIDVRMRAGHLSRDPAGIKPLFYTVHDGRLLFASELRALMTVPDCPRAIDPESVELYLHLGFIPHPRTIYRGVFKLPPGHRLDFSADGPATPYRFFELPVPADPPPDYEQACRQVRARITAAVQRQRVADVPLGAFLSGGLDSSIVVACLAEQAGQPIQTFSIGYADHPRYDETAYAQQVADHFGTAHHVFRLTFGDVLNTVGPMIAHMGEPFADSSLLPTCLVSGKTRRHVTVALSGDGADELFAGYWRYLGHHYLGRYRRIPAFARKWLIEPLLARLPAGRSTRVLDRARQMAKLLRGDLDDAIDRHLAWSRIIDEPTAERLLGADRAHRTSRALAERYHRIDPSWGAGRDAMEQILRLDLGLSLPDDMLHKVDLASMYHGLEVRVPMLAIDVVELAAGLPISYKLAGSLGKRILRDAFRDVLPPGVLSRSKMGFEVPVGEFLRSELRDLWYDLVTPDAFETMELDYPAATALYDAHLCRRADHTELLWALLVLCGWRSHAGGA